jgi:hypothetical protein
MLAAPVDRREDLFLIPQISRSRGAPARRDDPGSSAVRCACLALCAGEPTFVPGHLVVCLIRTTAARETSDDSVG